MDKTLDYTVMLEVSKGFFDDPSYDSDTIVQLKLPATQETLDIVLDALDIWDWREAGWICLDCRVPSLAEAISDAEDIHDVNQLSQRLADMEAKELAVYKALLSAVGCRDIQQAGELMDTLDQYILSPQFCTPTDVAKGELSVILCDIDAERLIPFIDLHQYGQELIRQCGGVLTEYGLLERVDRQPIQTIEQPGQGGMEMMLP